MIRRLFGRKPSRRLPEGPEGIEQLGHRRYVGGHWDEIGRLQFEFMRTRGLEPHHRFLDVACGALRAGVHFIPWLAPGRYFGIEKEAELVRRGLETELDPEVRASQAPQICVDDDFGVGVFGVRFDHALANSLFTHLPPASIGRCLVRLRPHMVDGGTLYASFFEAESPVRKDAIAHDHGTFRYTRSELEELGRSAGFEPDYLGGWGHPRGQHMMAFAACAEPAR